MSSTTKTITKAVIAEAIGTLLLGSGFYILFFSFAETLAFFEVLWLPLLVGFIAMFFIGRIMGNSFSPSFKYKVWHGVAIIFTLLIVAIITGVTATVLIPNWDSLDRIQGVISVVLIFLSFGGLPTLVVGIWLGYRLKK